MPQYGKANNLTSPEPKRNQEDNVITVFGMPLTPTNKVPPGKLKVPQKDLLVFFRQLSVMLDSGITIAQALEILSENMTNKQFSPCILDLADRLNAGEDLPSTLKAYPKVFQPIMIGLIEAGDAGGILPEILNRITQLLEARAKLRGEITGALVYPVLVLLLAISVSLGLLIGIVPKFKVMFDNMGAELPGLTLFFLKLSSIVSNPKFIFIAPISIFAFVYLFRTYYSTTNGRLVIDSLILKIPLFGSLILRSEMASMSDTLSTLQGAGIQLVEGLERSKAASNNKVVKLALDKSRTLVQQGQELSYSLSLSKVIPKLFVSMVLIGEETGALSNMLDNLSTFYKREVEETVSALTKAMEPVIIFVVAGIVGTIVIALYLPMFSLITEMGG